MPKRQKKHRYLPTQDGGFVRKERDQLTAVEAQFLRETEGLEGRNAAEIEQYKAAEKKLFE